MVHLDYRDARPIYSQIADGFREQIRASVLQGGDRLPSVRELAAQLAINPNTIQRAYRELESEGWMVCVQGKGCFVASVPDETGGRMQNAINTFDKTAAELLRLGLTREDLIARLERGGNHDA